MKKITYIAAIICLCFLWKGQAQNTKIVSLEKKQSTSGKQEGKDLEYLKAGTPYKLSFTKESGPLYAWNKEGGVEVVEFEDVSLLHELKNARHAKDFNAAKLLIINWNNNGDIGIAEDDLAMFQNLRYILIRSYQPLNENLVAGLIHSLRPSEIRENKIEILFETLEAAN
ncbi:hypothetical protein ED312_18270 [Sinomicrobium pectinilyticum]|uniref:Uncharacterized protein n=1 Tax=Sinomicrobium pectinilyticum TaxID=1084421 RepID=A0A3N0E1H2_SINP1|nr:hypothetical protein [Sinomicrobium pectinilyticum]RNL81681.1 hypothetical protein ED312_18270 [Sinomicrobium pectinilyticum]